MSSTFSQPFNFDSASRGVAPIAARSQLTPPITGTSDLNREVQSYGGGQTWSEYIGGAWNAFLNRRVDSGYAVVDQAERMSASSSTGQSVARGSAFYLSAIAEGARLQLPSTPSLGQLLAEFHSLPRELDMVLRPALMLSDPTSPMRAARLAMDGAASAAQWLDPVSAVNGRRFAPLGVDLVDAAMIRLGWERFDPRENWCLRREQQGSWRTGRPAMQFVI